MFHSKEFILATLSPDADGYYTLEDPQSGTQKVNVAILKVKFNPNQTTFNTHKFETYVLPVFTVKLTYNLKFFTYAVYYGKPKWDSWDSQMRWHPAICYLKVTFQRTGPTTVKVKPEEFGWFQSDDKNKLEVVGADSGYKVESVTLL